MKTKQLNKKQEKAFSRLIDSLESEQIELLDKYLDITHLLNMKRIERMGK